jgi:hypothetical protein
MPVIRSAPSSDNHDPSYPFWCELGGGWTEFNPSADPLNELDTLLCFDKAFGTKGTDFPQFGDQVLAANGLKVPLFTFKMSMRVGLRLPISFCESLGVWSEQQFRWE